VERKKSSYQFQTRCVLRAFAFPLGRGHKDFLNTVLKGGF